jgi:hypothetical protein
VEQTARDNQERFKVVAVSPGRRDDMMLLDETGQFRLYIGSAGTVSRRSISRSVVDTLLQRDHWIESEDRRPLTIDELHERASEPDRGDLLWKWVRTRAGWR